MSRDLFADLSSRDASEPETPMVAAQEAMKPPLIKRFYDVVELKPGAGGFHVLLDGRPVKTPQRHQLLAPHAAAAERLQAEWAAQETEIDPGLMPLTRLLNAAIDGVRMQRIDTASQIAEYLNSDLVCYRAEGPDRLVAKQAAAWQPVLEWLEASQGISLKVTQGLMPVDQDPEVIKMMMAYLETQTEFALAALHSVTNLTGSAAIALALQNGMLSADAGWGAAHVDEDWNIELWGEDAEAQRRRAKRRDEYDAAHVLLVE